VLSEAFRARRDQTVQDQYLARLHVCVRAATEQQRCCWELSPVAEPAALRDSCLFVCFILFCTRDSVPALGDISISHGGPGVSCRGGTGKDLGNWGE